MSRPIQITVTAGPNEGATVSLACPVRIGRAASCDVVLADPALGDRHASLVVRGRGLAIVAEGGPVEVQDAGTVEPGFRAMLPPRAVLRMAGSTLRVGGPAARPRRPRLAMAAFGFLCAFAFPAVLPAPEGSAETLDLSLGAIGPAAPNPPMPPSETVRPEPSDPAAEARRLTAAIDAAGFGTLSLIEVDGRSSLSGEVPHDRMADFRALERHLDDAFGALAPATDRVRAAAPPLSADDMPRIQSAWFGPAPYVVISDRRYGPGDAVGRGWSIATIASDAIRFRKGGHLYEVRLDEAEAERPPVDLVVQAVDR